MLNPDRLPVVDDARNPFFVGDFEGQRLREMRAQHAACLLVCALLIALAVVSIMAAQAWRRVATHPHACSVSVIDGTGNEYVVGQGDTLADAMTGRIMPPNPRSVIVVEGCNQ